MRTATTKHVSQLCMCAFLMCSISCFASSHGGNLSLYSHTYSSPAPIKQFIESFEGDSVGRGDITFTHNRAEVDYTFRNVHIGAITRYDYWVGFSQDTVQTVFEAENDLPIGSDIARDIFLDINHNQSKGINIAYSFKPLVGLSITPKFQFYQSESILFGQLDGVLTIDEQENISGELRLDYVYNADVIFDREPQLFDGRGWGVDLEVDWQINAQIHLNYILLDGLNQFTFEQATFTQAVLNSNRIRVNQSGVLDVNPALIGFEGEKTVKQRLPSRSFGHMAYRPNKYVSFDVRRERFGAEVFMQAGSTIYLGGFLAALLYQPKGEAYSFSLRYKDVGVSVVTDNSDYEQAHILGVHINLKY